MEEENITIHIKWEQRFLKQPHALFISDKSNPNDLNLNVPDSQTARQVRRDHLIIHPLQTLVSTLPRKTMFLMAPSSFSKQVSLSGVFVDICLNLITTGVCGLPPGWPWAIAWNGGAIRSFWAQIFFTPIFKDTGAVKDARIGCHQYRAGLLECPRKSEFTTTINSLLHNHWLYVFQLYWGNSLHQTTCIVRKME